LRVVVEWFYHRNTKTEENPEAYIRKEVRVSLLFYSVESKTTIFTEE